MRHDEKTQNWSKGAFTPNLKSLLSENLGGILGGTQNVKWVIL